MLKKIIHVTFIFPKILFLVLCVTLLCLEVQINTCIVSHFVNSIASIVDPNGILYDPEVNSPAALWPGSDRELSDFLDGLYFLRILHLAHFVWWVPMTTFHRPVFDFCGGGICQQNWIIYYCGLFNIKGHYFS